MKKTVLDITAVDIEKWQYVLEQSFSAFQNAEDISASNMHLENISILGCSAIKSSLNNYARQCFEVIVNVELFKVSATTHLNAIKDMLVMASRMRQKELFIEWFWQADIVICNYINTKVYAKNIADILQPLIFIICDKKYTEVFTAMRSCLVNFILKTDDIDIIKKFFSEWTSLIAQIGKRNWSNVTDFLMHVLFYTLLKKNNLELIKFVLLQLIIHYQMYSRWDGLGNAFFAYKSLHKFFYILVDKVIHNKLTPEKKEQYLLLVLRTMRDLVANIARVSMQDEIYVIRQLYDLSIANESEKIKQRAKQFMQMEIHYWHLTKPKTSKRQVKYLEDLLQENLLKKELEMLIEKIS